jgi:hypothetical protein
VIALLLRALIDVRLASHLGALLAGHPEFGPTASCIAWRESRHELVSVHEGDAWMERTLGPGMSTRGAHGLVPTFSLPPWLHWAPWLLDVPLFSAIATTRRAKAPRCGQVRGCLVWRDCR